MKPSLKHSLAAFGLLLLPILLLWPCLFGSKTYVPWDIAQFPPARTGMTDTEYQAVIENNNTDVTEVPVMFVPELKLIQSELAKGELPHWNPYARSGTPVWASSILGVWYPPNWLIFAFEDPADALVYVALLAIGIASLLMYGFLSHLGLAMPAALFGAVAFGMSGTLTVNLHFYQRINALIWLPGVFWAISLIRTRQGWQRLPAALGLTMCMFLSHTAGFPPFALVVTLLAMVFCARAVILELPRGVVSAGKLGLVLAGSAALGILMAAVQTLPMFEFFPESNRTMQAGGNVLASGGYDPAGWLGYLCPTLFTHPHINQVGGLRDEFSPFFWYLYSRESWLPAEGIPAGSVFKPNLNFCEYTVFVGTPTLLLALAGVCRRGGRLRWFAAGMVVVLFALASAAPWVGPLLEAPPFRWVPPMRFTGATCMFLALLAALGIHGLPRLGDGPRRAIWILALGVGLVALGLGTYVANGFTPSQFLEELTPGLQAKYAARFPNVPFEELPQRIQAFMGSDVVAAHNQFVTNFVTAGATLILSAAVFFVVPIFRRYRHGITALQVLLILMTASELLRFGVPLNTGRNLYDRPLNRTPVHEFLREQRDQYRSSGGFSVLRAHDPAKHSVITLPSQLPPDTLMVEHIRDQQAYTFVDGLSHLPVIAAYGPEQVARDTWPLSIRDDDKLNLPYWDMLGVRFILSVDELKFAGKRVGPVLSGPPGGTPTRFFYIYERPHPLPRAWVVHSLKEAPANPEREPADRQQDLVEALVTRDFAPAEYALIDAETAAAVSPPADAPLIRSTRTVAFPVADETNSLTIEVGPGAKGYLIVNDTKMKGWQVTVDGEPATIHRANLFQRMVVLPSETGTRVVFRYTTPGFRAGLSLTVLGLALCLVLLVLRWRSGRRGEGTVEVEIESDPVAIE